MNTQQKTDQAGQLISARRKFLKTGAVAAAGVAAVGMMSPRIARAVSPAFTFADIPGTGDVKVLNYALALEQLEADLYFQAIMRLTIGGTTTNGEVITGLGLSPNNPDVAMVSEFAQVEAQHRHFLTKALGSAGFTPYTFDFGMSSLTRYQVMITVYTAERLGVAAYLGAIPLFATRDYLRMAGAIQGTEARHTAALAQIINVYYGQTLHVAPYATQNNGADSPQTPDQILAQVSGFFVAPA